MLFRIPVVVVVEVLVVAVVVCRHQLVVVDLQALS